MAPQPTPPELVAPGQAPAPGDADLVARALMRRRTNWWSLLGSVIVIILLLLIARVFAESPVKWSTIPGFMVSDLMLDGLKGTIFLTVAVMLFAVAVGIVVAVARQSSNLFLRSISSGFVWIFRGVPTLVQLFLWFNIAFLIPRITVGPFFDESMNALMTPFLAALLGLGLAESAYMAEIVRGGFLAIPKGQIEAGLSIGMSRSKVMRRVILPQAIRIIIPPTGNQFIGMLKYTSLAFAASYHELLSAATTIYSANFQIMEVLFAAALWYLILSTVAQCIQIPIERHFGRSLASLNLQEG
jgi:polar amino acid transport system permease protein